MREWMSVECPSEGDGDTFYSPSRSVPARNKYGNIWEPPYVDKISLPAKARAIWCQSGAGWPRGLVGTQVPPLAPPFVLDTARWAPNFCMSVLGLCTSVFYVKWAHLASVMQDAIFCGFICVFFVFSSYFWLVSLQSKNHQNSWNSLVTTPTTTIDVHSSCLYAGVDGINFALKDRQQVPPHLIFSRPRAKSYVTMKHDFKRCYASIKVIPCHSSYLWIFEVSTMSSWAVEKWNGLDTQALLPNYEAYLEFL